MIQKLRGYVESSFPVGSYVSASVTMGTAREKLHTIRDVKILRYYDHHVLCEVRSRSELGAVNWKESFLYTQFNFALTVSGVGRHRYIRHTKGSRVVIGNRT